MSPPEYRQTVCELGELLADEPRDPEPGFEWLVLPRHGRRPLAVLGRPMFHANNRCAGLPVWSRIVVHETAGARLAATLHHVAPSEWGPGWRDSWLCEDARAVHARFHAHDPLWALPPWGYSRDPDMAFGADHLADRFRAAWSGLLGAVFGLSNVRISLAPSPYPPCRPRRSATAG